MLAVAATAAAAPRAKSVPADPGPEWAEPDPAAVVGRWRGSAHWKGCPRGAARVVLDVARDGSGYRVDLAPVLDGLGVIDLVPSAARRLDATRDDLAVTWTAGKPNRATLAIRFASGCAATLRLVRDGSGAPACDELAALERIGATCAAVTLPPIGPADRATIDGAPRGAAARTRAARTCTQHVAPLRQALVEVGCMPAPLDGTLAGERLPECEALLVTVARLMRCDKVSADIKQRLRASMQKVARWSTVAPGTDEAELRARATATCEAARDELVETMTVVGCAP